MGGDEFIIIIPPECYPQLKKIVEEIQNIFSKPWFLKDADYYCTMSMGIVDYPDDSENVQDLIVKADVAMFEAKKAGKNRVTNYSDELNCGSNKRLDMEKNMRDAAVNGCNEFEVFFLNHFAACVLYIEAVVPFLSFLSNRSFCHNRMSPFDIRQSELLKCFLRVSIS